MQKTLSFMVAGIFLTLCLLVCVFEVNSTTNFQVIQRVGGDVDIRDRPGVYYTGWSTITTMPRMVEVMYEGEESTPVTFYDNGKADLDFYIRYELPSNPEQRKLIHQDFQGNIASINRAVRSYAVQVLSETATCMSSSEHQTSRRPEFNRWAERQLSEGLWSKKTQEVTVKTGQPGSDNDVVIASQILKDANGVEIIAKQSPLARYGIAFTQFNVTGTRYDEKTEEQFNSKKESYLAAEKAKVTRDEEYFQREKIIAIGLRELAEIEKEENKTKLKATVAAQRESEVAAIDKEKATIIASQRVSEAEQQRLEAEQLKEVARIKVETAELEKKAAIALAEAKQKAIELGGTISDEKRILAEIACKQAIGEAEAWAKRPMPATVVIGGEGGNTLESLISMSLMKHNGLME